MASHQEDLVVPGETPLEEETSSTEQETGSALIRAAETRTSHGEQSATSVRPRSRKDFSLHPSHPRVVTEAEAALGACGVEEAASWIAVGLAECSGAAEAVTEVASGVAGAWTEAALVEEDGGAPVGPLDP